MKNLDWYIDEARRVGGVPSDGKLALSLGMARVSVNHWRQGKAWPSDENMIALARVAGISPAVALVDLAIWRAKKDEVSSVWKRLAEVAATLALPAMIVLSLVSSAEPAAAAELGGGHSVYYGKWRRFRGWVEKRKFFRPGVPFGAPAEKNILFV